jgi:acylphosphatase
MAKRVRVYYSGIVQGVGFRFTARDLAYRYKVGGVVRNLSDGRVELEIEGDDGAVNSVLSDLRQEFSRSITDVELEELPALGSSRDFQISF